jgi:putative phosphoesterase
VKLGVISDTHGLFDASIASIFAGVDAIIHAGDIGKIEIISRLEEIAPVVAVEGNNDWFGAFPTERVEEFAGQRVMIRHIFGELHQLEDKDRQLVERLQPRVVIFGHSHRPYREMLRETMLFNPGSAGPRRFKLPRTVGIMSLEESRAEAQIITLD